MNSGIVLNWLASTPDFAVPYALAALGLIICERAGVLSLGAEGLMLVGALAGIGAQLAMGQPAVSLVMAMLAASAPTSISPSAPRASTPARSQMMRPSAASA